MRLVDAFERLKTATADSKDEDQKDEGLKGVDKERG